MKSARVYTPTTNGIRNRYLWWYEAQRDRSPSKFGKYPDQVLAEFDRWLAEHDAEIWDEGLAASGLPVGGKVIHHVTLAQNAIPNPYRPTSSDAGSPDAG